MICVKKRRLLYISTYNFKLYKKFLSFKVLLNNNNFIGKYDYKQPNLFFFKPKVGKITERDRKLIESERTIFLFKNIYLRKEKILIRLLRFFFFLNQVIKLAELGSSFLISSKIFIYNGKELRYVNINQVF